MGIISRLTDQKGFDLLDGDHLPLLDQGIQLVVTGTGDQHYHQMFQRLAMHYPRQVAIQFTFNTEISQRIIAGSDMLLMPSRFEPCGLTQMLAMRYGSIPIVHQTGGLADTVQEFDPMPTPATVSASRAMTPSSSSPRSCARSRSIVSPKAGAT